MSKQPPPAPIASAVGPCPTIIQIVGRPGTGRLPRAITPPDRPPVCTGSQKRAKSANLMQSLIESMMGLRPRQGNLRPVFRLFSLMRGLPSRRLK